jgi:hypothetical protein
MSRYIGAPGVKRLLKAPNDLLSSPIQPPSSISAELMYSPSKSMTTRVALMTVRVSSCSMFGRQRGGLGQRLAFLLALGTDHRRWIFDHITDSGDDGVR